MLEIHEPGGAFERLDEWLRGQGFFAPGGESLVADLYLGYGLSSTIRRTATPPPPEPCPLPLAACVVRSDNYDVRHGNEARRDHGTDEHELEVGGWERTWGPGPHAVRCAPFAPPSVAATSTRSTSSSTSARRSPARRARSPPASPP